MTNEIITNAQGNIVKSSTQFDIGSFGGFSALDLTPSNLILFQGKNKLRDKIPQVKDGDLVIDSNIMPQPIEFIFAKSELMFDVYDGTVDKNFKITKESKFLERVHFDTEPPDFVAVDPKAKYPTVFRGDDLKLYEKNMIFVIAVNGLPCKISFKSAPKHYNAKTLFNNMTKSAKLNGHKEPTEAVFNLFSYLKTNPLETNKEYWLFDCSYSRPATVEEMAVGYQLSGMDLAKTANKEALEDAPF